METKAKFADISGFVVRESKRFPEYWTVIATTPTKAEIDLEYEFFLKEQADAQAEGYRRLWGMLKTTPRVTV
jgi:hypothetical protein